MRRRLTMFVCCAACAASAACAATAPPREVIAPAGAATLAPYSPAIGSAGLVFLSGQVGLRPGTTTLVDGGIAAETQQSLDNVRTILAAAGLTPADVVKCTVFLVDIGEYAAMNTIYAGFFGTAPPARSAVAVAALPLGARVEIECIARART